MGGGTQIFGKTFIHQKHHAHVWSQGLEDEDFQSVFRKPLSIANCVACGAFFALCFLHLVPQSEEKWEGVFTKLAQQKNNSSTSLVSQGVGKSNFNFEIDSNII